MRRRGFTLVEVLIAGVVFFMMMMVFQAVFSAAHGGEGRDVRRTQALVHASELLEQVLAVHQAKGDLPLVAARNFPSEPGVSEASTLQACLGGEVFLSPMENGFRRTLDIEELRVGPEDALLRPDRSYLIRARVSYPGPFGEDREVSLVSTRARAIVQRTRLERPPWE